MSNRLARIRNATIAAVVGTGIVLGAGTAPAAAQSPDDLLEACMGSPFAPICELLGGGGGDDGGDADGGDGDGGDGPTGTPLDELLALLPLDEVPLEDLLEQCRQLEAIDESLGALCDALEDLLGGGTDGDDAGDDAGDDGGDTTTTTEAPVPTTEATPPTTSAPATSPSAAGTLPVTGGTSAGTIALVGAALAAGALGLRRLTAAG